MATQTSQPSAMVVVTSTPSSSSLLQSKFLRTQIHANLRFFTSKPSSTSPLHFHNIYKNPNRSSSCRVRSSNGVLSIKAYMENPNSLSNFANKVIGSLPVIGLVARLFVDVGGVGDDIIDFAEFRRRVGKKCTVMDSRAFYEFQERRGKVGEPLYVLLCCWLAAVGAGLLKSEEILEGVSRLSVSDDIEFEEETYIAIMNQARERRARMKVAAPDIPMEIRVEKALEAIYVCCFSRDPIEEDDERVLRVMLKSVFPSVEQTEIDRIVSEKAKKVAEGDEEINYPEPKPISKEAVRLQMKDLEFLQQKSQS